MGGEVDPGVGGDRTDRLGDGADRARIGRRPGCRAGHQCQRDRATGREELYLWLRWLRDILLIQQGQDGAIVNVSWRGTLARQAGALTPADAVRWLHLVTESINVLGRNANPRLALEGMLLEAPTVRAG